MLVLEEYIRGDSLAYLLENGPLPPEYARRIALQVCQALEVLHGLGIVHRDIKPENILIRGDEAVLIDFDVSRVHKSEGLSDTRIMGTTGYAAPEQYGFSQTDARADIYSLGVLLNEMLTGKHPSTCLAGGPLQPVIEKCIEVNVNKRYSTAAEVIAALNTEPIPDRHHRRWLWAIPAAALLFAVLLLLRPGAEHVSAASVGSGEPSTPSPPAAASFVPDGFAVEWAGPTSTATTPFTYDLDGDGTEESYVFGLASDLPNSGIDAGSDTRFVLPDVMSQLTIAPGVATYDGGESVYVAPQFADLLDNVCFTLYYAERQGGGDPDVLTVSNLNGLWPNSVLLQWGIEDTGVWLYEFTAELDGKTLTARGVSHILADSSDGT